MHRELPAYAGCRGAVSETLSLAALAFLSACGGGGSGGNAAANPESSVIPIAQSAAVAALSFLHVGPAGGPAGLHQIVDANGRSVLLRGVNVVGIRDDYVDNTAPLVPQYPVDPAAFDGTCPQPIAGATQLAVCAPDAAQLRSFGYDAVRLPVSWSLLEPQAGKIDTQYIERIAQIVAWFKQAGIYTVIDLHQDAWSKYVFTAPGTRCPPPFNAVSGPHEADGAPQWASNHLTPACMLDGIREIDPAVEEDFTRFWLNLPGPDGVGLQDHFAAVVLALAQRLHDEPAVAGYELFNEPLPGLEAVPELVDLTATFPFYARVIRAVTAQVGGFRQLFFIEPDALRNVTDQRSAFTPWSRFSDYPNVVYAPHIYTHVFTPDAELASLLPGISAVLAPLFPLSSSYAHAVGDARALGLPLWVGEFGNDVADDDTLLRGHYQYDDQYAIGSALWAWKGLQPTGDAHCYCVMQGPNPADLVTFPSRRKFTARVYPLYTAGTLKSLSYDADHGGFDLQATASAVSPGDMAHATLLYLPAAVTSAVQAEGAQLQVLERDDGARDVYVYPQGGAYRVHT